MYEDEAILKNPDLHSSALCQVHVKLFENGVGVTLQSFLSDPARLHVALTKAMPPDIHAPVLIDGGSFNWADLLDGYIGIGSDMWSATKFELEVRERLSDLVHLWIEFHCWCLPDDDLTKLECLNDYAELVSAANQPLSAPYSLVTDK